MRKVKFENNKYYHIYNRGVEKREIFLDDKDFARFIISMRELNNNSKFEERLFIKNKINELKQAKKEPSSKALELGSFLATLPKLVEIICYCLNKNHYHFVLRQLEDNGIKIFMHKLGTGYANYFNIKNKRVGSLFQGPFQAKHIDTAKYLTWCSAYVNGNVEIHKITKAKNYGWSSYRDYLNLINGTICDKMAVMNEFNNIKEYEEFVETVIKDCQERKDAIKDYLKELD
jgi:REP element-mobilizing transposase RayT